MRIASADVEGPSRRRVVVDASVAAKWLLPEPGAEIAARLLDEEDVAFHVPELFDAELGNVLWKRVRRRDLTPAEALRLGALIVRLPAERHRHADLLDAALQCALRLDITCYDALYVTLSRALDATFVTADGALAERLRAADERVRVHLLAAQAPA